MNIGDERVAAEISERHLSEFREKMRRLGDEYSSDLAAIERRFRRRRRLVRGAWRLGRFSLGLGLLVAVAGLIGALLGVDADPLQAPVLILFATSVSCLAYVEWRTR